MATADIPKGGQPGRLDSWKEIAEYLRRDVRTAMRWESQGLPLHRVGGTGRSVFAFTHEIDAWMAGRSAEPEPESLPAALPAVVLETPKRSARPLIISVAAGLLAITLGVVAMSSGPAALDLATLKITETATHVSIADASGVSRVIHRFAPNATLRNGAAARVEDLDADGVPEIVAMSAFYETEGSKSRASGELLDLTLEGTVRWKFVPDAVMRFSDGQVPGPWSIADWQAEKSTSPKRIAVAAHDVTWWASFVAVLDHNGQPLGRFVNPGWMESVLWLSSDRLAAGGFNNKRDEAMMAILDPNRIDGQAPGMSGTEFGCVTCPATAPLFYATFARSEVNQTAGARFNRARLSTSGDRIIVSTSEIASNGGDAIGLYEFDSALRFLRARYSDTYWDEHTRLEREGRLSHSREQCPDRDGPAAINVWDSTYGWVRTTPSDAARRH